MTSTKGWLERAPDGRRRMTSKQKDMTVRAVHAAMDWSKNCNADDFASEVRSWVVASLEEYPDDKSCVTCDFFLPGGPHCLHWEKDVPQDAIEAGCGQWKDDAAPF